MTAGDVYENLENPQMLFVDVRESDEWANGHVPGARHIPLRALPNRLEELDKSKKLIIYCQVGARSSMAVEFLMGQGFENIAHMHGGLAAWTYPIDGSP